MYGDPSPNNAFVPGPGNHGSPWLIDVDNMHYAGQSSERAMCTPRYGAPELERGEGSTTIQTDLHALAVLVFQVLTLVHPLLGDSIIAGAPSEEVRALQGGLPWVDDDSDVNNRCSYGVARACVLTNRLQALAQRAFGAGRMDSDARPTATAWLESLHAAALTTVDCTACRASFYAFQAACAWCGMPRPAHALVYRQVVRRGMEPLPDAWQPVAVLQQGGRLELNPHGEVLASYDPRASDPLRLSLEHTVLRVSTTSRGVVLLSAGANPDAHVGRYRPMELVIPIAGLGGTCLSIDNESGCCTLLRCERVSS